MKTPALNLVLACVSLFFLANGIVKFFKREERQTLFKLLSNLAIWGSIVAFSLFPPLSRRISHALGFGDNLNTLIFFGFVAVFIALFKLVGSVERLERNVSEIVRREALEKLERLQERDAAPRPGSRPPPD